MDHLNLQQVLSHRISNRGLSPGVQNDECNANSPLLAKNSRETTPTIQMIQSAEGIRLNNIFNLNYTAKSHKNTSKAADFYCNLLV